ncbi:hypothetical protein B0H11DRAFT_1902980 [Mycena galericulata]|nr:hypothetical protein B0H11DRAFT_1902980 [Mycena galericulata]
MFFIFHQSGAPNSTHHDKHMSLPLPDYLAGYQEHQRNRKYSTFLPPHIMTDHSLPAPATAASTPQEELDALVKRVSELSQMALDMTRLCIDVQTVVPGVALSRQAFDTARVCLDLRAALPEAFARATGAPAIDPAPIAAPFDWVEDLAPTPDQMDSYYPPGVGDDLSWHVVCIGREPGLYASPEEANKQILGVPNQFRQKKDSRVEALAFYRLRYDSQRVHKMVAVPIAAAEPPPPLLPPSCIPQILCAG